MGFLVGGGLGVTSYFLGAIPFAFLLGRMKGVDVRAYGSGNVGATNIGRVLGRPYALVTFVLDAAKGALPVIGAGLLWDRLGWDGRRSVMALCGLGAIAGHLYPDPGSYTVRLVVTNPDGDTDAVEDTVTVIDPDVHFAESDTYCFANSGTPGGVGFEECPVSAAAQHAVISAADTDGFETRDRFLKKLHPMQGLGPAGSPAHHFQDQRAPFGVDARLMGE